MNKQILTAITMIFCATAQANIKSPGLTSNYDSVLQANINDLNLSDTGITKKQLRGAWAHYLIPSKVPINLDSIKVPVHKRFVNTSHYFSDTSRGSYELDSYVLKEQLTRLLSQKNIICEYKASLSSYYGNKHFDNLDEIKNEYFKFATDTKSNARSFIDQDNLQGYVRDKNDYNSGLIHVLVKHKVLSLTISDCTKATSKEQIIKDLTEWGKLLIEANQ